MMLALSVQQVKTLKIKNNKAISYYFKMVKFVKKKKSKILPCENNVIHFHTLQVVDR